MLGVHDPKPLDIGQSEFGHTLPRLAQHGFRDVDAAKTIRGRIVRKRYAGADANLEDAPADAFGGRDRSLPTALENSTEYEIIDWRPPRIGLGDRLFVESRIRQVGHGSLSPFLPP